MGIPHVSPSFFVFLFNEYNAILPNSGGQHYLDLSLMQYKIFIDNGFMDGINSLYNLRSGGLRPLIFPSLVTPFMLLVNGRYIFNCEFGNDNNSCNMGILLL